MARTRHLQDLTVDELRFLLLEKRRAERKARLDAFDQNGSLYDAPRPMARPRQKARYEDVELVDDASLAGGGAPALAPRRPRPWLEKALLAVEVLAAVGLVAILINGISLVRSLNQEVASALVQPTLTPTALIMAVVLPSGHTPPNDPGGVQPNIAEIPEHLRPLVQSMAEIPVPTASPQQAIRLQANAINIDYPVVQGDGWEQLKKGIGQKIGTPNPGEKGNMVLSAHNDIFGEIFRDLDKLKPGDVVTLFTGQRTFDYVVRQTLIVEPTQVSVMDPTPDPVLTLISCYPYMVDNQRIVVKAYLQE